MGRTVRDIHVYGRGEGDVWNPVMEWMKANGGWVAGGPFAGPQGSQVTIQMGAGIAQATRYFEIAWRPFQGGVSVHTEGYAKGLGQEMDFNPGAIGGGLPRREGWRVINDLWNRLAWLSSQAAPPAAPATAPAPTASPPAPIAPPAAPAAASAPAPSGDQVFCTNCGTPHPSTATFCGRCGTKLVT